MVCAKPDTRQRLIDTAQELLWKKSYGSVSVDDICKAANVNKGSFYHFFPSKAELAIASMEMTYQETKTTYDQIFSASKQPITRFEDLADYICERQAEIARKYSQVCGCPASSLSCEMAGQEQGIREKYDEIIRRKESYYESALRDMAAEGLIPDGTDIKSVAHEISTFILGQLMLARIQNDIAALQRDLKPGLFRILGLKGGAPQK
ncbi:MAG: TetR family transcriptional regulator [Sideroxydans sp.]|nr:TetR family transcriptional regulator [Sideroxydans sp.]